MSPTIVMMSSSAIAKFKTVFLFNLQSAEPGMDRAQAPACDQWSRTRQRSKSWSMHMCKRLWIFVLLLSRITLPAFAQTASDLFNPGVLHEIRISIHPTDWQNLKIHFDQNTHYPADFHWLFQGRDIQSQQVSVRSRGGGSRSGVKPGLA